MNAITPINAAPKASPFKVGNFEAGQNRGEVSRQWISRSPDQRFLSLADLHAKVAGREAAASEAILNTKKIEFFAPDPKTPADTNVLWMGLPDGSQVGPNHWAFNQLCSLGKAPAAYLRRKPSQFVADALTHDFRYNRPGESVKSYVIDDELCAATGPDYGRYLNSQAVSPAFH